jgi:hypothetical protein
MLLFLGKNLQNVTIAYFTVFTWYRTMCLKENELANKLSKVSNLLMKNHLNPKTFWQICLLECV